MEEKKYEIIKFSDGEFSLDVNVSPNEDTVWLTQPQMAKLYGVDRSRITRHINNILSEKELPVSTCAENALVQTEGKRIIERKIKLYNLDMILCVGYRIKSPRGNTFRRWANSILKQYLISGHAINNERCLAHSDNIINLINKIEKIKTSLTDRINNLELKYDSITSIDYFKDKIFYNGELFEGYSFIKSLFNKSTERIIIIDGYVDYSVLEMLLEINTNITIFTFPSANITNREIQLFKQNHQLNIIKSTIFHDRFIIIDDELYNIGSSIKDIGKKVTHISKLESINITDLLNKCEI